MSTSPAQLHYLLQQYANNNCTRQELLHLLQAMEASGHDEAFHNSLLHIWQNISHTDQLPAIDREMLFSNIMAAVPVQSSPSRKYTWLKMAAAAVLVLALGAMAWLYLGKKAVQPDKSIVLLTPFKNDKAARIGKAILSLANGQEIVLDDAPVGTLVMQGRTTITKQNNRQLVYTIDGAGSEAEAKNFNILTTPPGSQYEVILPDESHVWVNAASAIRFPTAITGRDRSVDMTGEAYFEVTPLTPKGEKKKMPFIVNILPQPSASASGGLPTTQPGAVGRVEVLGTHFNIKAYGGDEDIQTTLLEGKVKVSATMNGQSSMLQPGQQAAIRSLPQQVGDSLLTVRNDINVNDVIAWKKGELLLRNLTLSEAAPVIERWYNVHIDIKNPHIANCRISVSFLKGETIQQVMDVLGAYNDFTWKMKNNTITLSGKGCD